MADTVSRRDFLKRSAVVSAGAALTMSLEEKALMAQLATGASGDRSPQPVKELPTGRIGNLTIGRIICGGNLISSFAHSRDLTYISSLLRQYFTDEKVWETLRICEENGINTAILRLDDHCLRILNGYWNDHGGKIQWIAQCKIKGDDFKPDIQQAIDNGALGAYLHGGEADKLVGEGRIDVLGRAVEFIKQNGVLAGVAGHMLDVPIACEKAGLNVDFYMKTLHSHKYWSAGIMPRNDSVWSETPEKTIEFMKTVKKPWIAYKVLAAGAIHPKEGFKYAFENGADFLCVGMFDFQVIEDVLIARDIFSGKINRQRAWMA
jgi:hypothetical protein